MGYFINEVRDKPHDLSVKDDGRGFPQSLRLLSRTDV